MVSTQSQLKLVKVAKKSSTYELLIQGKYVSK